MRSSGVKNCLQQHNTVNLLQPSTNESLTCETAYFSYTRCKTLSCRIS